MNIKKQLKIGVIIDFYHPNIPFTEGVIICMTKDKTYANVASVDGQNREVIINISKIKKVK